jgi:hypothetical protein
MEEKVFFNQNEIQITNSRIMITGQTYAMSGVTSVASLIQSPKKTGPIVLALLGILMLFAPSTAILLTGIVFIGLAVFWFIKLKPTYLINLTTSSGEAQIFSSKDESLISSVVDAINEAIVARG